MKKLLFIALLFCLPAFGQVTVSPFVTPNVQFLSNSGTPLAGGKVCTFAAGSTTPQTSYSDSAGSVANANPVVLDSAGRASIWLTTQTYKIVVAASTANSQCSPAITSTDNISWATMANTVTSLVDTGALTVQASAAATSGANQSSPLLCVQGNYWTGAASASDKWCLQDLLGTGSNPTTTLNVTHGAGSSGTAAVSLPTLTALTVTGASTLSSVTTGNVSNHLYIDGTKYPITRAGIQQAFTDACAIQNASLAGGVTVYLPANMQLTINGTTDANSANEVFLITCALNVEGTGPYPTVFSFVTAASSAQAFFRVKPTTTASQGRGRFTRFQITGDNSGGNAIVFDGSALNTAAGGPHSWDVDHTIISGLSSGAHAISLVTCPVTCDQSKFEVRENLFGHGVQFGGGSAGDSILIEHNKFAELAGTTPCIDMNLQTGSALLTAFNNNGGCQGGFFIGHAGGECKILYNQIEQESATNEANDAIIDIQGDIATIDGCEIIGNNLNAHTFVTNNIRLDKASNTTIESNVITVKAVTGVGVLLTANPTFTRLPWNDFSGVGGGAVAYSNPSGTSNITNWGPNGTAAAASYGFINAPNSGLNLTAGTPWMDVSGAGVTYWTATEVRQGSGIGVNFSSAADPTGGAADTGISRCSAGVLCIGNGTPGNTGGNLKLNAITSYVGTATADFGVPSIIGTPLHLTGQTGNIASTAIATTPSAGSYIINATCRTTTSGTGTTGTFSVGWTDEGGAKTFTSATWALNSVTVTGWVSNVFDVRVASGNITFSTSTTIGTSAYACDAWAMREN